MINVDEVKKIAELCKLDFANPEKFTKGFDEILEYVKAIGDVESSAEISTKGCLQYDDLRDDVLEGSFDRQQALLNKQSEDSEVYFSVPKTVER